MINETVSTISGYADEASTFLFGKLIVAVVILLIGFIFGRLVSKIIYRVLNEIELDKTLKKVGINFALEKAISSIFSYIIYVISIILALNELGLTTTILNIISVAAIIFIILSVLIAIKDFIPNLISGFIILKNKTVKEGDLIVIDNIEGKVKNISLIETEIKTKKGDIIHIPNAALTKKEFIIKKL